YKVPPLRSGGGGEHEQSERETEGAFHEARESVFAKTGAKHARACSQKQAPGIVRFVLRKMGDGVPSPRRGGSGRAAGIRAAVHFRLGACGSDGKQQRGSCAGSVRPVRQWGTDLFSPLISHAVCRARWGTERNAGQSCILFRPTKLAGNERDSHLSENL